MGKLAAQFKEQRCLKSISVVCITLLHTLAVLG
jgi:hypothetical protein